MPIRVERVDDAGFERIHQILDELKTREDVFLGQDRWTPHAIAGLPDTVRALIAQEDGRTVALLLLIPGLVEPWAAPMDLLGGNPVVPMTKDAVRIHVALLSEASAWVVEEGLSGLEILLPMGPDNMHRDDRLDAFHERLGFARFYYTMTRDLDDIGDCPNDEQMPEIVPAAAFSTDELFVNYTDCLARGEIELIARQSETERREYFDDLVEETLGHPASLALIRDDELIGFTLVASISETAAHLAWIGVAPGHRGRGLGRRLLCDALATCKEHQIERMSLYTDTSVGAQTLYHRLGFEPAGTLTYRWRRSASDS
jgi:ribosomal protein S18 acetylase RimI-like enzyme